jgi:hypothetical protein
LIYLKEAVMPMKFYEGSGFVWVPIHPDTVEENIRFEEAYKRQEHKRAMEELEALSELWEEDDG